MIDETTKKLISFLVTASRNAHREERKWEKSDWLRGFNGGLSTAYLTAARITKAYQKQDKKRSSK